MPGGIVAATLVYLSILAAVSFIRGLPLLGRRLLRVYATYGLVAFGARGLYLAVAEPKPMFNDRMPIPALYEYGYDAGVSRILWLQTASLATIAAVVWLLSKVVFNRRDGLMGDSTRRARLSAPLAFGVLVIYLVGWVFRIINFGTNAQAHSLSNVSAPLAKVEDLALLAPAFILLSTDWWRRRSFGRRVLAFIVPCEVGWVLLANTKAPAVALVVAAYLGSPDLRSYTSQVSHRRVLALASCCALVLFSIIDGAREPRFSTMDRTDALLVVARDLVLSPGEFAGLTARRLLVRFDGLDAASLAYLSPSARYMDVWEAGRRATELAVPSTLTGEAKETPGGLWARRMAGTKNVVSLAEGIAPEGYAVGGFRYLLLWSGLLGTVSVLGVLTLMRSRPFSVVRLVACGFVASPALYERGLLGIIELAATALQLGAVAWLILSTVSTLRKDAPHQSMARAPHRRYGHSRSAGSVVHFHTHAST